MTVFNRWIGLLAVVLMFHLFAGQAGAQSDADEQWSISIAPYGWLAALEGEMATLPPLPASNVNLKATDILKNLEAAFMMVGEFRKGRWGVFGDMVYSRLSTEADPPYGVLYSKIDMQATNLVVSLGGSYRGISNPRGFLDLQAGGRYWSSDTELVLKSGFLKEQTLNHSENWIDPFIGVKGRVDLGRGVFLSGWGNLGGFGVGSNFSYDIYGGLGYEFNATITAALGYRVLYVDYEHDDFYYRVTQHGPTMAFAFHF